MHHWKEHKLYTEHTGLSLTVLKVKTKIVWE